MSKRMDRGRLGDAALTQASPKGALDPAFIHRPHHRQVASRKKPERMAVAPPIEPKLGEGLLRQGHIAVFVALAPPQVQHHPATVNILDLQLPPFLQPQPTGIDGAQTDPLVPVAHLTQNTAHFLNTQNDRQLVFRAGADKVQDRPFPSQRLLIQKLEG